MSKVPFDGSWHLNFIIKNLLLLIFSVKKEEVQLCFKGMVIDMILLCSLMRNIAVLFLEI